MLAGIGSRKVAVLGHQRPDGDCIGSQVAIARLLRNRGHEVICLNRDSVPRVLKTFVGDMPFLKPGDWGDDPSDYLAIATDCADKKRFGQEINELFPQIYANIDHHVSNNSYAEHNFIIATASATAEILAGLFLDEGISIDPVTAQALYIGIATDTGQFRFGSTTKQVFEISTRLSECGADPAAAAMELYENESRSKLDLLQRYLASFEYLCGGRVCLGRLSEADFAESGATKEDTEGLVDFARAIEGVAIGVLVEQHHGNIKGSFRAKDPAMAVHDLAKQFNGGGHACAAGFNMDDQNLDTFIPLLKQALEAKFLS